MLRGEGGGNPDLGLEGTLFTKISLNLDFREK